MPLDDAEQGKLDRLRAELDKLVDAGSIQPNVRSAVLSTMKRHAEGLAGEIDRIKRETAGASCSETTPDASPRRLPPPTPPSPSPKTTRRPRSPVSKA